MVCRNAGARTPAGMETTLSAHLRSVAMTGVAGLALMLSACTSGPPPTPSTVTVTATVTAEPASPPAITDQVLENLTAPPMCQRQSGRLVDGKLPGIPAGDGETGLAMNADKKYVWAQSTDPQASPSLVVAFSCNAGGVEWPNVLGFFGVHGDLLGSYDLGDIDRLEHSKVSSIDYRGGLFHVEWAAYEGAGSGTCVETEPDLESADFYVADGKPAYTELHLACERGD